MKRKSQRIRVRWRKLGREQAAGQMRPGSRTIEVDERLRGHLRLWTLIHEVLHVLQPEWSEEAIDEHAQVIADTLWAEHYRMVEKEEKKK